MKRLWLTLVLITLAVAPALADERARERERASQHARRAVALYEMGRFEGALAEFEAAFYLYPTDTLLYNLAQTHRRLAHCREAVELYRTLLDRSPDSDRAPAVRRLLPELEQACKVNDVAPREVQPQVGDGAADAEPKVPAPTLVPAAATRTAAAAAPAGEADDGGDPGEEVTATVAARPASAARVYAGLTAGGLASGASVTPLGVTAGATWRTARLPVELGGQLSAAGFSWAGSGYRGTSSAIGVLVTAGKASRRGALDLRLDVGAGVTVLSGLATGHPLLARGRRVPGGTTTVPQLEVIASGERGLGSGWAAIAGIRAGAARGGDTFGGALLSFAALVGIGHAL